jgi:Carboxypeptidase regulatory-like domain
VTRILSLVSLTLGAAALSLMFALSIFAQTATTGTIVGTVTDKNGAAVAGAEVQLTDRVTNQAAIVTADENGRYVFASVLPGDYNLTGAKQGFRKTGLSGVKVEAPRSYTINLTLEAGEAQQIVEIAAPVRAELQTGDSTVGNVLSRRLLPLAPALSRQVNELIRYQPLVTPDGAVAGSRQDQSTFFLDGIDVTDNAFGGLMRLPIEAVDEFHVGVANPNASFGRGAGGQVSVIGRRGGADFHGAAYWFHQNDALNAATWTNKRTLGQDVSDPSLRHKIQEPEMKDNRFGFNFGGPYPWYENFYFFMNYEGRRAPRVSEFKRLVPTDTLKQGVLRFRDASGNVVDYNLASATLCGDGTGACDPRALGLSPAISQLWSNLPAGNDTSLGDGLNIIGYRGTVSAPLTSDYYNARFDYDAKKRWRFDGSIRYFGERNAGANQLSIIGGANESLDNSPTRQNMIKAGMTGQLTDNMIGAFAVGWARSRVAINRTDPNQAATLLAITGTGTNVGNVTLDIDALDEPIDIGAPAARMLNEPIDLGAQATDSRNYQINADFNWLKGGHTFQFGSNLRYLPTSFARDNKPDGSLNSLIAQVGAGGLQIPAALRPPTCDGTTTVNCLQPGDEPKWDRLYASALGLVDNISLLAVRDEHFNILPAGAQLVTDARLFAPEVYLQDVWRARPSLTLTYGLNYGWQTSPKVKQARMTILVDGQSLTPQTAQEYLRARDEAARRGEIFNPLLAFQPVNDAKRSVFDTDWNNVSPRASAAWSPSYANGFLGKLFGDRKTVIRGGYSLIYDRQNAVQSVINTTQGVAFGQTLNLAGLPLCNATGDGGMNCDPAGANVAANGFRVGVDGLTPLPVVPEQMKPFSPVWGLRPGASTETADPNTDVILFPEAISFQVDPSIEVAQSHAFDLTWQRELPGNMIFEAGYVGRYTSKLPQNMSLSQVPFQHLDTASNQTFAQAFDALAAQLRGGTTAANVAQQGWFENQLRGTPICNSPNAPANNCTAGLAAQQSSNIKNGNLNGVFEAIDRNRLARGMQSFNNYLARTLILRSSTGRSNYNAAFATVRKRFSQGLLFTANYTFSRSLDQLGVIQSAIGATPNSFDLDAEYGPSTFDITHMFNATGVWELPFGKGRLFDLSGALDKAFGGWYSSWIFTAQSGAPLVITQGPGVWGGGFNLSGVSGAIPTTDLNSFDGGAHEGVNVSSNVGSRGNAGSQINFFEDPEQVFNSVRHVEISRDGRSGRANPLRGLSRWNLDMSFGKKTTVMENKVLTFSFDFFNILNKVDFADPSLDLSNPDSFGVITEQFTPPNRLAGSRWIQLGMRLEF